MTDVPMPKIRDRSIHRTGLRRPLRSFGATLAATTVVGLLGGCLEQSDDLLGTAPLPALATPEDSPSSIDSSEPSLGHDGDANPWSRDHWSPVLVAVPMASTIHQPTYVDRPLSNSGSTTAGRLTSPVAFPTTDSALVVETDAGDVILSGLIAPAAAALDLVVAPVRMILSPPWTELEGPEGGWVLLPRSPTVTTGGDS